MLRGNGRICSCSSYGCRTRTTRTKSGKTVRGREVTPSELRLHSEKDAAVKLAQSERGLDYAEYESAWPPLQQQSFREFLEPMSRPVAPATAPETSSASYLGIFDLFAIRTDLIARMSIWNAQILRGVQHVRQSSFPHGPDLRWLRDTAHLVSSSDVGSESYAVALKAQLLSLLASQTLKMELLEQKWEQSVRDSRRAQWRPRVAMANYNTDIFAWPVPAIAAVALFIVTLESAFHLPRKALTFVLAFIQSLVRHTLSTAGSEEAQGLRDAFENLPKDPRTILEKVGASPHTIIYASCPTCGTLARPSYNTAGSLRVYPEHCAKLRGIRNTLVPCGAALLMDNRSGENETRVPIIPFAYSSVSETISMFLQDPTLVSAMTSASEKLRMHASGAEGKSLDATPSQAELHDILEGRALEALPNDFLTASGTLRLVFSLSVDWFHPRGSSKRASVSLGLISLTCLNLPPEIRFSPENVHLVGVLPGPRESAIQPFLVPLVDELLALWRGQNFRTTISPVEEFIAVRAALVPVVCDMQASRKVIAFVSPSPKSKMVCPYCMCTYASMSNRAMIQGNWQRRTRSEWMEKATKFRDSLTVGEKARRKTAHGIMWSELLRLPYWDPTRFTVVDAMHNLLLGLLEHHVRVIWGISAPVKKKNRRSLGRVRKPGKGPNRRTQGHIIASQKERVAKLRDGIRKAEAWLAEEPDHGSQKLARALLDVLKFMCEARNLLVSPKNPSRVTKQDYITALLHWAQNASPEDIVDFNGSADEDVAIQMEDIEDATPDVQMDVDVQPDAPAPETSEKRPSKRQSFKVGLQEIETLRNLISMTSTPGWLGRVASDFGSRSHGTPKADEWRTVGTVQLPVALIRMWSGTAKQSELDWFLDLVTAVQLAIRRSTSASRAADYSTHLRKYLNGLIERGFRLVPNHHAALHLGELLCQFGPVRGWWAFATERQVGLLQKIGTSNKFGEMESTIGQAYHRAARLRTLLSRSQTTEPILDETLKLARSAFREPSKGSLRTDNATSISNPTTMADKVTINHDKTRTLLPEEYNKLKALLSEESRILSPKAQMVKSIQHLGVTFSPDHWSYDNSNVIFRTTDGVVAPGRIVNIFLHERGRVSGGRVCEAFVSVKRYRLAGEDEQGSVRGLHASFGACICHDTLEDCVDVFRPSNILFHFASLPYEKTLNLGEEATETRERLLVWPLNRE